MKAIQEIRVEDIVSTNGWDLSDRLLTQLKQIEPVFQDFGTEHHWKPYIMLGPMLRKMCESQIDREYVEFVLKVYLIFRDNRNPHTTIQEIAQSELSQQPATL